MKNKLIFNHSGFTLVELLITLTLLSILIMGSLTILNPIGETQKALDAKRKSDLKQLQNLLELYYNDNGTYPASLTFGSAWPPYSPRLPNDPNPAKRYGYRSTGQAYYMYASLDRGSKDPQACNGGSACTNATGVNCGDVCNFGLTSPNVTP